MNDIKYTEKGLGAKKLSETVLDEINNLRRASGIEDEFEADHKFHEMIQNCELHSVAMRHNRGCYRTEPHLLGDLEEFTVRIDSDGRPTTSIKKFFNRLDPKTRNIFLGDYSAIGAGAVRSNLGVYLTVRMER